MSQSTMPAPSVQPVEAPPRATASSIMAANRGAVGLLLASVILAAVGQLTFKAALNQIGALTMSLDMVAKLLTNPILLIGLAVFAASAFMWLVALMRAELSFAYPFLSLSYVLVLVGGAVIFNERITPLRVLGFAAIIAGIFIVASSARTDKPAADRSPGSES